MTALRIARTHVSVGQQLRELREHRGLGTRGAGQLVRRDDGHPYSGAGISKLERTHADQSIERCRNYARALGRDLFASVYDPRTEEARVLARDDAELVDAINDLPDIDAQAIRDLVRLLPGTDRKIVSMLRAQLRAIEMAHTESPGPC